MYRHVPLVLSAAALRRDLKSHTHRKKRLLYFLCSLSAPGMIDEMAHLPPEDFLGSTWKGGRRQSDHGEIAPASSLTEKTFISSLGRDVCGTSVLQSSVEGFTRDTVALEAEIAAHLQSYRPRR